jgi:hypothetical protein
MSQAMIPFHVTCPRTIYEGDLTKFIRSPSCKSLNKKSLQVMMYKGEDKMFHQRLKQVLVGIFMALFLMTMPAYAVESVKVSNYGSGVQIWFEVEDFDERDPADNSSFALSDEPGAFGRTISSLSGSDGASMIRYTFDISKAGGRGGTWYFWGRVINPNNNSDFMLVEGHPGDQVPFTLPVSGLASSQRIFEQSDLGTDWVWGPTAGSAGEEAHTKTLKDGENTMYILAREAGATWDVFMWTNDPDYVPTDSDYENAMQFVGGVASNPSPVDGAIDVPREAVLSWKPGEYAPATNGHRIYFHTVFSDVKDGTSGIVQDANLYVPPQRLDFETTFYWRVDEIKVPPDSTVYRGNVWSFTTEPIAYPIHGVRIMATASSSAKPEFGPQNTINGSGLDADDLHSVDLADMWLSDDEPQGAWIQYEFDKAYKLYQMWVWNGNQASEDLDLFGLGLKAVNIEYSTDGATWMTLADMPEFSRGFATTNYAYNTIVDFAGAVAKYVKLTASSNWGGLLPYYNLSEVRFFTIPEFPREPIPDTEAIDVNLDVTLTWRAGRDAATHDLYLSDDSNAMVDGTAPVTTVTKTSYGPLSLDLGKTYYWRVDEVNDAETPTTWQGDIWSFTTQEYLVVDDFEAYNDIDEGEEGSNRIYLTWSDGFDNPANGSQVGYLEAPFTEKLTVHGGRQAMPLFYTNTDGVDNSEAALIFDVAQDWTRVDINALTLFVYGKADNIGGQFYVKIDGVEKAVVVNLTDESWQEVNIEIATFGVDLQQVTSLAISIKGAGSGMVFVDDIRLHP